MAIWYRNSFQTVLRLKLSDRPDGGTDLTCRFGLNRFVVVFMAVWFAGVVGMDLVSAIESLFTGGGYDATNLIFPLLFCAFGVVVVGVGRFVARNERMQLLKFLTDTLDVCPPG